MVAELLQVNTDIRLSQDAYQRLIKMKTHRLDEDMEEMLKFVWPRGALGCASG
jgi:hypothetical protein